MSGILFAFLILSVLGLVLGIGLSIADKKFSVAKDPKLVSLEEMMPGANCGACGYAGCSSYAQAVFEGIAKPGLCVPGGKDLADKMGNILGVSVEAPEKKVAFVFCKNSCKDSLKTYKYFGIDDCNAASILFKGDNACKYGCLHMGSCIKVCDTGALYKNSDGDIKVDKNKCIGCGKCASVCPNQVIKLIPADASYVTACNSHDNGAAVRKNCNSGCIGCKICEVKFPESGFKVVDNLAVSDYKASSENAKKAAEACPRKVIVKV